MKRKPIIIALALLFVVSTAFAQIQGKGNGMQMQGTMKGENCQILTDDERMKVGDAKRDFEKIAIPLRADVKVLKMELDELIVDGKSAKEISTKLDELNAVKAKLSEERVKHQIEVRKIVGEDKYKQMKMYRQMPHHNKGGKGQRSGGKMNARPGQGDCRYPDGPRYK